MKKKSSLNGICIIASIAIALFLFPSIIRCVLTILLAVIYLLIGLFTSGVVNESSTKYSFINRHKALAVMAITLFWPVFYFYGLCVIVYKTIIEIKLRNS